MKKRKNALFLCLLISNMSYASIYAPNYTCRCVDKTLKICEQNQSPYFPHEFTFVQNGYFSGVEIFQPHTFSMRIKLHGDFVKVGYENFASGLPFSSKVKSLQPLVSVTTGSSWSGSWHHDPGSLDESCFFQPTTPDGIAKNCGLELPPV